MVNSNCNRRKKVDAAIVDRATGEIVEDTYIAYPRVEKVHDWLRTFHKGTEALAKDRELGAEALRVFLYCISHVDYDNRLLIYQADVVRELDMKQASVSRAFRLLVSKKILIEGEKVGTTKTYYLSTDYGWKGTVRRLKKRAVEETEAEMPETA